VLGLTRGNLMANLVRTVDSAAPAKKSPAIRKPLSGGLDASFLDLATAVKAL